MSIGQAVEVVIMFLIGAAMVNWKLKRVILIGLVSGFLRYVFYALDAPVPLLIGVALHGFAYTFTYISTQIYLARRIAPEWRTRAQALLSLLVGGVGCLIGYLVTGSWLAWCTLVTGVQWQQYWTGLNFLVLGVLVYFTVSYHGYRGGSGSGENSNQS
jgi:MFS family permease